MDLSTRFLLLLSIWFRYVVISLGIGLSWDAYFFPMLEKNSQKVFVILSGSYRIVSIVLIPSIT